MLKEVWPEMKTGKYGRLITSRNEGASHNRRMLPIKTRCREIVIHVMHFKAAQGIEVILRPLPCVASNVIVPRSRRRKSAYRILRRVCKIEIRASWSVRELFSCRHHYLV